MQDMDKLKHLISHWAEHNVEHAATYDSWAIKAGEADKPALKRTLKEIVKASRAMDDLFADALKECG